MKPWQFNIMFGIAATGAVLLLISPYIGLNIEPSITQLSGYSAILAYVLGHKSAWISDKFKKRGKHIPPEDDDDDS